MVRLDRQTRTEARLAVRFTSHRSERPTPRADSVAAAELVMRDLRRFAEAAAISAAGAERRQVLWDQLLVGTGRRETTEFDLEFFGIGALPVVMSVRPGSLERVVEVTALAAAGASALGRFLYLIERYWHLRLRLHLEEVKLRAEIEAAGHGDASDDISAPSRVLANIDEVVVGGKDEQETAEVLTATVAVLTGDEEVGLEELEPEADEPDATGA